MTRRDVIGLVRAAFGAAALFLAGGVVPAIGGVAMLFAPTPVLSYAIGYPRAMWRMAAAVTLASGLIALGAGLAPHLTLAVFDGGVAVPCDCVSTTSSGGVVDSRLL